jgi:tetratricopeptide (TPR) repeat protein
MAGVPPEERQEIMSEIEEAALDRGAFRRWEPNSPAPRRAGTGFPIIVNLLSVVALLVGAFLLFQTFQQERVDVQAAGRRDAVAEQLVIEEIRRTSQAQLARKDGEIEVIRGQLRALAAERRNLYAQMDARITERIRLLETEMRAAVDDERRRLVDTGLSEAQTADRISLFVAEAEADFEAEIERIRLDEEVELRVVEGNLASLEDRYRRSLDQAMGERDQILADTEARLAGLREQYESDLQSRMGAMDGAQRVLERLTRQNEQAELVRMQIRGLYESVSAALEGRDFVAARGHLDTLEELLNRDRDVLATLGEYREVELFIVEAIGDLIDFEARFNDPELIRHLSNARAIQDASALSERARALAEAGDTVQAASVFREAVDLLPPLGAAYTALLRTGAPIASEDLDEVNRTALELVGRGRRALDAEEWLEAMGSYARVATFYHQGRYRADAVDGMVQVASLMSEEIADLNGRLDTMEREAAAVRERLDAAVAEATEARDQRDAAVAEATAARDQRDAAVLEAANVRALSMAGDSLLARIRRVWRRSKSCVARRPPPIGRSHPCANRSRPFWSSSARYRSTISASRSRNGEQNSNAFVRSSRILARRGPPTRRTGLVPRAGTRCRRTSSPRGSHWISSSPTGS